MLTRVVGYIKEKQPKLFVIENVKNLLSKKHSATWGKTLDTLKNIRCPAGKLAYKVQFKVLNSKHFGLAQNRERVYLVGCSRSVASRKFRWPVGMDTPPLAKFLDKGEPAAERRLSGTNRRNIDAAVARAKAAGLDPQSVDIIVDIGCSAARANMMHDLCPAITKTRGAALDFWLMSAGRRLTIHELLRLQGFSRQDLNLEGVSERQVGQMVGNAMSVPVLSAVLREGLSVCGMR
jgi:DNA (cytosine-5)-methyltransferase 1